MSKSKKDRWRVGNFVVRLHDVPTFGEDDWRLSDNQVRRRVQKGEIGVVEALEISSLDGAWMVRLQPGSQMHSIIMAMLGDPESEEMLSMFITNIYHTSVIPNGYFHQALVLLLGAYYHPELLNGGMFNSESRAFRRDAKAVRDKFLAWYEESKDVLAARGDSDRYDEMRNTAEDLVKGDG